MLIISGEDFMVIDELIWVIGRFYCVIGVSNSNQGLIVVNQGKDCVRFNMDFGVSSALIFMGY